MTTWQRLILSASIFGAFAAGIPAQAQEMAGTYLSQSGETRVRMSPCGSAFCGTIVWVSKPGNDVNNPDPAKRDRSLVGIQMIFNMKSTGGASYAGSLYNYQDGKTYTGKAKVTARGLDLSGCVLGGLICRSQSWTRVD